MENNNDEIILKNIINESESDISIDNNLDVGNENTNSATTNQDVPNETFKSVIDIDVPKLERRGRHKKNCNCDRCKAKTGNPENENKNIENKNSSVSENSTVGNQDSKITDSNPLDLSEFKKVEISTNSQNPEQVNASKYLTGAIILMMVDAVIPSVLIKMMSMANPKYKSIRTKDVKMSKDQKNDLEPLADEVVKSMVVSMSPMTAFLVCTSLIYGTNIMSAVDE